MSHGLSRKFDYSDIVARDGDGRRYELVDGELLVIPAPGPICSSSRTPATSPGAASNSRRFWWSKFCLFPRVEWIVDPDEKRLECFRLAAGEFAPVVDERGNATLAHPDWDGLVIDLAALWR